MEAELGDNRHTFHVHQTEKHDKVKGVGSSTTSAILRRVGDDLKGEEQAYLTTIPKESRGTLISPVTSTSLSTLAIAGASDTKAGVESETLVIAIAPPLTSPPAFRMPQTSRPMCPDQEVLKSCPEGLEQMEGTNNSYVLTTGCCVIHNMKEAKVVLTQRII
ncbi:hypothetical protein HAX54_013151 [Datura stramonium]|uniref:Uncharacterized protein n=1 Tax=Datura stramonium TaxID=4076 RepID=A0ABS8TKT4_DATST|nr:hypothetical protein [Datura stramonium]